MENNGLAIDSYDHYAPFLKERFRQMKLAKASFSYAFCAKKIGSNASYLKHVLEGRKKIGLSRVSKIASVFQLTSFERQYFTLLVIRDLAGDDGTRDYLTNVLARMSSERQHEGVIAPAYLPDSTAFPLLHWLFLAIIELTAFKDFSAEPKWIKSRLIDGDRISDDEVKSALKTLVEKNILAQEGGRFVIKKIRLSLLILLWSMGPTRSEHRRKSLGCFRKSANLQKLRVFPGDWSS